MGGGLSIAGAVGFHDSVEGLGSSRVGEPPKLPIWNRARWLADHILPYEPVLRSWLRARRIRGLDVDDIIQDTYAVLAGLASVDHIGSPRAYAFRTAYSLIQRQLRRGRIARFESVGDTEWSRYAVDEPSPEQQAAAREQLRRLSALVAKLPARRREAFTLHKLEGLSYREVARRMGVSEGTVEKHVASALLTLMRELG